MEADHQDAALIAKGKRTKRQRLHSPTADGGFSLLVDDDDEFVSVRNQNDQFSTSSSNNTTEEEQDMANCLILLARGTPLPPSPKHVVEKGVVGCYGYECKTCFRTFTSFQALGGHRASHKKPKVLGVEKKLVVLSSDNEEMQLKSNMTNSLSHQRGSLYGKGKVHECGICGAEFTSGQALGGHMRRHRAVLVGTNTALSLTPMAMEQPEDQRQPKRQRSVVSLDLDLNLPAPQEHDHQSESKFFIKSNQQQQQPQQQHQQQQPLVFPARTLVDCHY